MQPEIEDNPHPEVLGHFGVILCPLHELHWLGATWADDKRVGLIIAKAAADCPALPNFYLIKKESDSQMWLVKPTVHPGPVILSGATIAIGGVTVFGTEI